jgi:hypothetical protein
MTLCKVALYAPLDHSSIASPTLTRKPPGGGTGASYHAQVSSASSRDVPGTGSGTCDVGETSMAERGR